MVESEEHFANLLHEEHHRLEACQCQYGTTVQMLEARLREAALREEHLLSQLHAAKKVLQSEVASSNHYHSSVEEVLSRYISTIGFEN